MEIFEGVTQHFEYSKSKGVRSASYTKGASEVNSPEELSLTVQFSDSQSLMCKSNVLVLWPLSNVATTSHQSQNIISSGPIP